MQKALYGLRQAGREWYFLFQKLLKSFGFSVSDFDPCLFYLRKNDKLCVLGVHVDDSLVVAQDPQIYADYYYS